MLLRHIRSAGHPLCGSVQTSLAGVGILRDASSLRSKVLIDSSLNNLAHRLPGSRFLSTYSTDAQVSNLSVGHSRFLAEAPAQSKWAHTGLGKIKDNLDDLSTDEYDGVATGKGMYVFQVIAIHRGYLMLSPKDKYYRHHPICSNLFCLWVTCRIPQIRTTGRGLLDLTKQRGPQSLLPSSSSTLHSLYSTSANSSGCH